MVEQALQALEQPLGNVLEKQIKTIEDQREKQIKTVEDQGQKQIEALENRKLVASLFSKDFLNEEATYNLNKDVEMENKLDINHLIYKTCNKKKGKTIFKVLKQ